jgi:hypothetical protein
MPGFAIDPGGGVLAAADDQIWTCGAGRKNRPGITGPWRAIGLGKARQRLYIRGQGVPVLVCRRAFARFKENMAVRTLFLLGILRDFSERSRSQSRAFFGASVSGSCRRPVLSETAGAGCRLNVNRLHRWGRPFAGLRALRPVRTLRRGCGLSRPAGQDFSSAVLPALSSARVGRRVATGGSRILNTGRQAERVCSGSSG